MDVVVVSVLDSSGVLVVVVVGSSSVVVIVVEVESSVGVVDVGRDDSGGGGACVSKQSISRPRITLYRCVIVNGKLGRFDLSSSESLNKIGRR